MFSTALGSPSLHDCCLPQDVVGLCRLLLVTVTFVHAFVPCTSAVLDSVVVLVLCGCFVCHGLTCQAMSGTRKSPPPYMSGNALFFDSHQLLQQ